MVMQKKLFILGTRGIPAEHGGFETFAEYLSIYLVKNGWEVTVYCQESGFYTAHESNWNGVKRIHIPVNTSGALGTIVFDLKSILHASWNNGLHLTLGYNTALFNVIQRLRGIVNIVNMDGIEWKRQKWGRVHKLWFWLNEGLGCWFGNHLIADHPKIKDHLALRVSCNKISVIPYGGLEVKNPDKSILGDYKLVKNEYVVVVARPEPENSILEMVEAFSYKKRGHKLVILGDYSVNNRYHQQIKKAASKEVIFVGAIYDSDKVSALRFYSRFYMHGHQVGGTNPSLVEALGASCAVIAHDNQFNRWVASNGAFYFKTTEELKRFFESEYLNDDFVEVKRKNSLQQFLLNFQWQNVLEEYEILLRKFLV